MNYRFIFAITIIVHLITLHSAKKSNAEIIEFVPTSAGLYSNLSRLVEWIYCINHNQNLKMYINYRGAYDCEENLFEALFEKFDDASIFLEKPARRSLLKAWFYPNRTECLPGHLKKLKFYPTDGMKNFEKKKYVYCAPEIYKDPEFSIFRWRINAVISRYLRPVFHLQKKIDTTLSKINLGNNKEKPLEKIGLQVRYKDHYMGNQLTDDQFLDAILLDVDEIMKNKDLDNTVIFLASLIEPLVSRLSAKYKVVTTDIPRTPNINEDWSLKGYNHPHDIARDAIVDVWCLANCDELYCGASNMAIFAACLNPNLKINLMNSLKSYDGA